MPKKLKNPKLRAKAVTRDVVGEIKLAPNINSKWQRHYQRLIKLHASLINRKIGQVADAQEEKPVFSLHMADAGTDNYDQDFALGIISSEQDALYEIEEAINRITNDTYGLCEMTGKRIESKRLAAIPWTRFSVAAEKLLEQQGVIHHAKLCTLQAMQKETSKTETKEE